MEFSDRQKKIIQIVKENEPITGNEIAAKLGLSKPTLRSDLALLTMTEVLTARQKVGYIYAGKASEPMLQSHLYECTVEDLMIPPVFIKSEDTLKSAVTDLFIFDVGSLYVINEEKELIGILSRKDLLRASLNNADDEIPVAMIMTRMPNIVTITKDKSVLEAGDLIMSREIDSLPVVEADNPLHVIGKVSKTNIMNYFIQEGKKVEG